LAARARFISTEVSSVGAPALADLDSWRLTLHQITQHHSKEKVWENSLEGTDQNAFLSQASITINAMEFDAIAEAVTWLEKANADLEPELLTPDDTRHHLALYARAEKLATLRKDHAGAQAR
jgi:hypothetical protein